MKSQRDQLLEILASGVDFKGEITFVFDTTKETIFKDPAEVSETQRLKGENEYLQSTVDALIDEKSGLAAELELVKKAEPLTQHVKAETRGPRKKTYNRQLSNEQVWDIRDYIKLGLGDAAIRDKMNGACKASAVWRIRRGLAYNNVGERPHSSVQPRTTIRAGHSVKGEGETTT